MNTIRHKISSSLGTYFVLLIAGIMVVAMLLNTAVQHYSDVEGDLETMSAQAGSLSNMLAEVSIAPILGYDYVTLQDYARDAGRQQYVVYVVIRSANGEVIASYLNEENLKSSGIAGQENIQDKQDYITGRLLGDDRLLESRADIVFGEKSLGSVWIGFDTSHTEEQSMQHLINQFIVNAFTAGLIAVILIFAFQKKIVSRLHGLIEGADKVSSFQFDHRLDSSGNDELSTLASAFNNMTQELRLAIDGRDAAIEEVERQNMTLEERVAERSRELQSLNKALSHQALHDPLTGLPNRVLVMDRLQSAMIRARRSKKNAAIFMLDLDKFKDINDTLGHPVGDRLLQAIGRRLKSAIREDDTIGRLGGDEFAVVLPETTLEKTQLVAAKLLSVFSPEFVLDSYKLSISASLGIAMYPEHGEDQATLLKRADVAMYMAKNSEKSIALYDPEKDQHSPARLEMITALRNAIDEDSIEVAYQPIINVKTGAVDSTEALARWRYLKQDISPGEFIPIVDESGMGQRFAKNILAKVIGQAGEWSRRNMSLPVSVNLSIRNIDELNLPSLIGELLQDNMLSADLFKIEITESELMADPEYLMNLIHHPALEGVQYSIDDFGTGYSSLSYLKKLAVHQVKIDQSFITEIDRNDEDYAIAKAIIDLSHSLGLEVVAEGVETETALHTLLELGCDHVQGYLFSKPLAKDLLVASIMQVNKKVRTMLAQYKQQMA